MRWRWPRIGIEVGGRGRFLLPAFDLNKKLKETSNRMADRAEYRTVMSSIADEVQFRGDLSCFGFACMIYIYRRQVLLDVLGKKLMSSRF